MRNLKYMNADGTAIYAERDGGAGVFLEAVEGPLGDLYRLAKGGALGKIAAYDPPPAPTEAELLAVERADMRCSPLQGILALGEAEWGKVLAYRETATWGEKAIIDHAGLWRRNSENIAFFGHLLQYTPTQIDNLFRAAMQIEA